MAKILLEMKNITKTFPGVKALDHVSLTVRRGTVHALMGENGAGKSTLYEALNELKGMPRINTDEIVKERVKIRINKGGHGISEEDIERRYVETFKNLKDVLKYCDLAAFYDNTKNFHRFAIFRNGEIARISTILPTWFKEKELVCSTNLSVSVSNKLL